MQLYVHLIIIIVILVILYFIEFRKEGFWSVSMKTCSNASINDRFTYGDKRLEVNAIECIDKPQGDYYKTYQPYRVQEPEHIKGFNFSEFQRFPNAFQTDLPLLESKESKPIGSNS